MILNMILNPMLYFFYGHNEYVDKVIDILNSNNQIEVFSTPIISIEDCKNQIRLAAISYCPENEIKSKNCTNFDNSTVNVKVYAVIKNYEHETQGFVSINHKTKKITVSYRGTKNIENWRLNFEIEKVKFYGYSKIHSGFKTLADSLLDETLRNIKKLSYKNPEYGFVFTGHSMGGAIAVINAVETMKRLKIDENKISVYTYGQPRVGDKKFTEYINKLKWNINRVFNKEDFVSNVPPNWAGYYHTNVGIGIDSAGNTIICNPNYTEDNACLPKDKRLDDKNAHFKFWDYTLKSSF